MARGQLAEDLCLRPFVQSHLLSLWKPVLDVTEQLTEHVEYLQMGANYLPALTETAELTKLQASGRVSLALPITGPSVNQWHKKWEDIASEFGCIAYDPPSLQYG